MNWFGKKNGNDPSGRLGGSESVDIPSMLVERLASEHEPFVISAIAAIMREGKKYRGSEVVDKLATVLQYPHGPEVIEKAGDALIEKLKNGIHLEDAQFVITSKLGKRTELNAKLFLKMLDRLQFKPEIKKLAVEMLASFRGVELKPEFVDEIEMALLQRVMDKKETDDVKAAIKLRFGREGKGRPQLKVSEGKGEETIVLDKEPAKGSGPAAKLGAEKKAPVPEGMASAGNGQDALKLMRARDVPTESMDIIGGFLVQLRDGDALQRERAAKALGMLLERSASAETAGRLMAGVSPFRSEFPELFGKILAAAQKALSPAQMHILMLKEGDIFAKEKAAASLIRITEDSSTTREQLEKIRDGVAPLRAEFPSLYRIVLKAMQNMLPDAPASRPPIAVSPSGEARRLGERDPTPVKR